MPSSEPPDDAPADGHAPAPLQVVPATETARPRARRIATRLGVQLAPGAQDTARGGGNDAVVLRVGDRDQPLALIPRGDTGPVTVDLTTLAGARPGRDPLLRAVRTPGAARRALIDATGGLGADAFALAAAGYAVRVIERVPVLALLLEDALERAHRSERTAAAAERVTLVPGDARALLAPGGLRAEVIYLDPMYPTGGRRGRKRARTNKAMRLFRDLVGDDLDADELLRVALAAAERRVVVKRPANAEPLAGIRPSGSIDGRTTRFDLLAPR